MFEHSVCLRSQLNKDVSGRKIAFVTEGFECCDAEVCDVIKDSFKYFRSADVTVEEVSIPWHKKGRTAVATAVCCRPRLYNHVMYIHRHQC